MICEISGLSFVHSEATIKVGHWILQAVTKMIQEAFTYVDQITDMDTKLKLIDTLITVTSGKVGLRYQMLVFF